MLVAASAATTVFALSEARGIWVAVAWLALALLKARVLLSEVPRLSRVPPVRRGFMAVLVLWSGSALALVLAAQV